MRLLDCGCGLGSITVGLAEVVSPGDVVGIDVERQVLDMAQRSSAERGLGNISFAVADVYHLPFPDASFDAAVAHTLLVHLREPRRALEEIRRVLKPGGVAGVSDPDFGTHVRALWTPLLDQLGALLIRDGAERGKPRLRPTPAPATPRGGLRPCRGIGPDGREGHAGSDSLGT